MGPQPSPFQLVQYKAYTFGRWAVGILLECFLVHYRISSHKRSFYVNVRVLSVIYVFIDGLILGP